MKVKVCGMTNDHNLSQVLNCSPDFVGFIFYDKSQRNVTDTGLLAHYIKDCKKVGVFVNEDVDEVIRQAMIYKLDYVQLHGDESPDYCGKLETSRIRVIKAFAVNDGFDFSQLRSFVPFVEYFLFDTKGNKRGGNGTKFNWEILDQYKFEVPFFLSGGIGVKDIELINAFEHPRLYAIDVNSGFETSPGIKNANAIDEFINQLNK